MSANSVLVNYGLTEEVTLTVTAPQDAEDATIIVRGINTAGTVSLAEVKLNVTAAGFKIYLPLILKNYP